MQIDFVGRHYNIEEQRSVRLYAELLVYLIQRCVCKCRNHLSDEKATNMLHNWPGSTMDANETNYLHRMLGMVLNDVPAQHGLIHGSPIDLGMGAEYCIQKICDQLHMLKKQAIAEMHQCKPHQN